MDMSVTKIIVVVVGTIIAYKVLQTGRRVLSKFFVLCIALSVVTYLINYFGL